MPPSSLPGNSFFAKSIFYIQELIKSDFFKKVAETFSTRILLILLSLATGVMIARTLGPEGRGFFAMAMFVGAMGVQLANLGIHSSNTLYVSRDNSFLRPLLGNSLAIGLGFGGFAAFSGCCKHQQVLFTQ